MPITRKPDGSLVFDTVEEAVEYERAKADKRVVATVGTAAGSSVAKGVSSIVSHNEAVNSFIVKLDKYDGERVTAQKLAPLLGTSSTTGVGPRLRAIRNVLIHEGTPLEEFLKPYKEPDGTTTWMVTTKTAKSS